MGSRYSGMHTDPDHPLFGEGERLEDYEEERDYDEETDDE